MSGWKAPDIRVAWHAIGHISVAFYLSGVTYSCVLGGGTGRPNVPAGQSSNMPTTPDEWLAVVALDHGGRAAVEWAMRNGYLAAAPVGVEAYPGEYGFLGPEPESDERLARQHAAKVAGMPGQQANLEGLSRARACVATNSSKISILVLRLVGTTRVSQEEVATALS